MKHPIPGPHDERVSEPAALFAARNLQTAKIKLPNVADRVLLGLLADSFDAGRRFEREQGTQHAIDCDLDEDCSCHVNNPEPTTSND